MQEREPGTLLRALVQVLSKRGVPIQHALFVPPDSRYTSVAKLEQGAALDLSWQVAIRSKWEALTKGNPASQTQASMCHLIPHRQRTVKFAFIACMYVAVLNLNANMVLIYFCHML